MFQAFFISFALFDLPVEAFYNFFFVDYFLREFIALLFGGVELLSESNSFSSQLLFLSNIFTIYFIKLQYLGFLGGDLFLQR